MDVSRSPSCQQKVSGVDGAADIDIGHSSRRDVWYVTRADIHNRPRIHINVVVVSTFTPFVVWCVWEKCVELRRCIESSRPLSNVIRWMTTERERERDKGP